MLRMLLGGAVALTAVIAVADTTLTLPPDDNDFRAKWHRDEGNGLNVAVASFRTVRPDGMTRLTYNVCNLDSNALIFRWPKPYFESGIANPLAQQKCAVYVRDVPDSIFDGDSKLLYWQRGDPYLAQAFLEKLSGWGKAERAMVTWLYERGFGLGPDRPEVRDVELVVREYKGHIYQQVTWSGRARSVAFRIADPDEKTLAQLRAQIGAQIGDQGKVMPAKEFVGSLLPADQSQLPSAMREGFILMVSSEDPRPASAKLSYELGESVPAAQPVVVLDANNRLVWIAQYSTVRKK